MFLNCDSQFLIYYCFKYLKTDCDDSNPIINTKHKMEKKVILFRNCNSREKKN